MILNHDNDYKKLLSGCTASKIMLFENESVQESFSVIKFLETNNNKF